MSTEAEWEKWSMKLADSQSWEMVAGPGSDEWLCKTAGIMEIKKAKAGNGGRITFVCREFHEEEVDSLIKERISRGNWESRKFWPLHIFSRIDRDDYICEICKCEDQGSEIMAASQALYPIYGRALRSGGTPLHAALIELGGKGYAIAAPSGTGKSTCCRRIPPPWHVLCDDELLAVRTSTGQYHAHPFPTWSEYKSHSSNRTWNVQEYVPLSGIFILKRSSDDEISPLGKGEASTLIYHSARQAFQRSLRFMKPEKSILLRKTLFENACQLAHSIPAFALQASLTGNFWRKMEEVIG